MPENNETDNPDLQDQLQDAQIEEWNMRHAKQPVPFTSIVKRRSVLTGLAILLAMPISFAVGHRKELKEGLSFARVIKVLRDLAKEAKEESDNFIFFKGRKNPEGYIANIKRKTKKLLSVQESLEELYNNGLRLRYDLVQRLLSDVNTLLAFADEASMSPLLSRFWGKGLSMESAYKIITEPRAKNSPSLDIADAGENMAMVVLSVELCVCFLEGLSLENLTNSELINEYMEDPDKNKHSEYVRTNAKKRAEMLGSYVKALKVGKDVKIGQEGNDVRELNGFLASTGFLSTFFYNHPEFKELSAKAKKNFDAVREHAKEMYDSEGKKDTPAKKELNIRLQKMLISLGLLHEGEDKGVYNARTHVSIMRVKEIVGVF